MIDHGDIFRQLQILNERSARTAFSAFSSRRICIFNAPTYVLVDGGSNRWAELMKRKLHEIQKPTITHS